MKTFIKILFRTIGLPFIIMLAFVSCIYHVYKLSVNFMKYGGELIAYPKKDMRIHDVYEKLEELISKEDDRI